MSCNKEKKVWTCLIDKYKDMEYLWKKEHEDYANTNMRAEGVEVLLKIYKEFDEDCSVDKLKKKMNNMRTNYRRELKKVQALKDTSAEEEYVPTLWYFDLLRFLDNIQIHSSSFSNCPPYRHIESCRVVKDDHDLDDVTDPLVNVCTSSDEKEDDESARVATPSGVQKKRKNNDSHLQKRENILLPAGKLMSQKDEECEVFGRSIGLQMRDLNKAQLAIAEKVISDVLFYAKFDKLTENSAVALALSNSDNNSEDCLYMDIPPDES